jgi:hypothetical protein
MKTRMGALAIAAGWVLSCAAGGESETTTATTTSTASAGGGGTVPGCDDGVKNEAETDVDCGGDVCPGCADGKICDTGADCDSGSCPDNTCHPAACDDGLKNGTETAVDCGGSCPGCAVCWQCGSGTDCETGVCQDGLCAPVIDVLSAVYAANCGAPTDVPTIVAACEGQQTCAYLFNYTVDIGYDPAYGCYKDLKVEYACTGGMTTKTFYEACAPCDPQNTPTMINLALECEPCLGEMKPPP